MFLFTDVRRCVGLLLFVIAVVCCKPSSAQAEQRRGAFSLTNASDVVIPFQLWDGVGWYNSSVNRNTILRININIYPNGRSHHQPSIRFDNGNGKVRTYRLEYYEIFNNDENGKVYDFKYDDADGWDLHTTD